MGARLGAERALVEGEALERALFWARIAGGAVILVLGPLVSPRVPDLLLRGLAVYLFAYAVAMRWMTARATSGVSLRNAIWLGHALDTAGFLVAMVLNASDPRWTADYAAPLLILVGVARIGALGGISAAAALAMAHVALAFWRDGAGIAAFDVAREISHVAIYGVTTLLITAIDMEQRLLRHAHDVRLLGEVERTQRLEGLGALAGGIAHDLNNVLATVQTAARVGLMRGGEAGRALQDITETAERGASFTRQLLAFARGTRSAPPVRVDVRREVRYAERVLGRTLGERIRVDVRADDDLPDVMLEAGQLEAILVNLAVNSRDAIPREGRIVIEVAAAEVRGAGPHLRSGRYLRIVVADDGLGMTPETQRHAFDPFFTTKPTGHGAGLGLWSVRTLARRLGGDVSLVSAPGRGTAVTVHIPALTDPRPAVVAMSPVEVV